MSVEVHKAEVYQDVAGKWRWRGRDSNGEVVADSGQGYADRKYTTDAVRSLFPNATVVTGAETMPPSSLPSVDQMRQLFRRFGAGALSQLGLEQEAIALTEALASAAKPLTAKKK